MSLPISFPDIKVGAEVAGYFVDRISDGTVRIIALYFRTDGTVGDGACSSIIGSGGAEHVLKLGARSEYRSDR